MSRVLGLGLVAVLGLGVAACETTSQPPVPLVAAPSVCSPKQFEVYFADSQAGLTPAARQAITLTADMLKDCDIRSVKVTGLADARGGASANLSLSERRAQAVAEALEAAGWPIPAFEVSAMGDEGAVTEAGIREPLRRRTEVLVDAAPR